jgi:sodium transport system permease protein
MRSNIILTIFGKEIKEVLRDKRMLYLVILLPFFLYPVLFTLIGKVGADQQDKLSSQKVTVLINPEGQGTPVFDLLKADTTLELKTAAFDRAAIDTAKNTIGVWVAPDYAQQIAASGSAKVTIYVDESKDVLSLRKEVIAARLQALNQQILGERLRQAQLSESLIQPLAVETENVATKEQLVGKVMGGFLPMIILMFIFVGCVYIAIDITAGEKERRTLQTLYSTTASKGEIIAGKFLAVASVGIVSAAMNILSLLVAMQIQVSLMSENANSLSFSVSPQGWLWLVVLVLLSTVFLGALCLAVVLLANSYKEAQSYVSPMMMLILIPAMLSQMPGMELNASTALIPMLNISLAMGAVVKGAIDPGLMAMVVGMALLYALVALWLASRSFGNESVITGEKVNFRQLLGK